MLRMDTPLTGAVSITTATQDLNTLTNMGHYEGFNCTTTNGPNSNVDNDWTLEVSVTGNTLIEQTFQSAAGKWVRSWTPSSWGGWTATVDSVMKPANNLSELASAATARSNLGLGTAATTAATDYATSTQGGKADTAVQPATVAGYVKHALIAGGVAGDHSVSAIKTGDVLLEVLYYAGAGTAVTNVLDLTGEFTIKAGNGVVTNGSGTDTSGGALMVRWTKLTV